MFERLFKRKEFKSNTGFFKVDSNTLIEIDKINGNGSINNCIEYLGFPKNHIHIVSTFNSNKIECLGFKTLSKELVFVLAKNKNISISFSDVLKDKNQIDWNFEYSSLNVEDILNEGISLENLNTDFLKSVIDLTLEEDNLYISKQLGLYLQFDKNILKAFTSLGWDNSSTKWLENLNSVMVKKMLAEATKYHGNKIDAMEEVNKQTDAYINIPSAIQNEFIPLHRNVNDNVSFYNLLIAHYNQNCTVSEFLFMNKGRYIEIDEQTYNVGEFVYKFGSDNKINHVFMK